MAKVEIYTTTVCVFCARAKQLFKQKHVDFIEIPIDRDPTKRDEMIARTQGGRTVPQIFINDQLIGGSDDLFALESAGKLDALLQA